MKPFTLPNTQSHSCHCIGTQNGDPVCPCHMKNLRKVNGRWVETIDHGPVREYDRVEPNIRDEPITKTWFDDYISGHQNQQSCMHEELDKDPNMKGKPRMLSCPCPKCSPWC